MTDGRTHWDECWRERGHQECAVAMVERLRGLLREIAGHRPAVAFFAPQLAGVVAALDRIAAHLAREEKP